MAADRPDFLSLEIASLLSLEHKLANRIRSEGFWEDEDFAAAIAKAHAATRARANRLNEVRMEELGKGKADRG